MTDLEFFFDPVCPWAWITSRWVHEVQQQRSYDVAWRFISLKMINANMDYSQHSPGHREVHIAGTQALRVAACARAEQGNDAVFAVYTMFGNSFHPGGQRDAFVADPEGRARSLLADAGLPSAWATAVGDESFDEIIAHETEVALGRTGKDVGTPILTFRPGAPNEGSFFGPVISSIPRGEEAARLWDAIEVVATTSNVAELKRSLRAYPTFD